jgi:hypothetical protein
MSSLKDKLFENSNLILDGTIICSIVKKNTYEGKKISLNKWAQLDWPSPVQWISLHN